MRNKIQFYGNTRSTTSNALFDEKPIIYEVQTRNTNSHINRKKKYFYYNYSYCYFNWYFKKCLL